jgi:glycosyltransferase involved in cell wall biosynthesis
VNELLYLSFDSLQEGVGSSQVLAYVRKIVHQRPVRIISFEKEMPDTPSIRIIQNAGIAWTPLPFGRFGVLGGLSRLIRMWLEIDRKKIIHARGNLSGLAALLRFPRFWIWDCRSLHADQRRALSDNRSVTPTFIAMRIVEYFLAKQSAAIIVITNAVIPLFISRYKIPKKKISMISTCVDTERFTQVSQSQSSTIKILLAGTFSPAYDIILMNDIIAKLRESRKVWVTVAASVGTTDAWKILDYDEFVSVQHSEMPNLIAKSDLGLSIWKNDLGICLTSVASTKAAEFLACGRPIFVNSLQGDFGSLVKANSVGVVTLGSSSDEVEDYVSQILNLLADPDLGRRCRALAETSFNLNNGVARLLEIYSTFEK